MSVRFMSCIGDGAGLTLPLVALGAPGGPETGSCDAELEAPFEFGGGGGTADVRGTLFFPRPSKMSRSEPLLLSSDIRVS